MKITLDNYEQFVLDFLEGNLEPQEKLAFNQFLDDHPVIRIEISGVDDLVLVPDMESRYPDKSRLYRKQRAPVLPIWRMNRVVAAAVALLLVSATALFIWKSPVNQVTLSTDHTIATTKPEINHPKLPATRTPLPESRTRSVTPKRDTVVDRPETNVMAHKGKEPGRKDDIRRSFPAQISGTEEKSVQSLKDKTGENEEQIVSAVNPVQQEDTQLQKPTLKGKDENFSHQNIQVNTVAFLPLKQGELTMDHVTLHTSALPSLRQEKTSQEFKIHIPGEFLSETWTDVSLTNFKKKVIPEFIKNQLNL